MTPDKREERAIEALIVLNLRQEIDPIEIPELLPQLNEEEKAVMNRLGPDLIDRLRKRHDR